MTALQETGQKAVQAKYEVQKLSEKEKNRALLTIAEALVTEIDRILAANEKDLERAEEKGMKAGLIDRLRLTEERIKGMAEGIEKVTQLPDPVGELLETIHRPNGLVIEKRRVPLGVVGIIYESRPNVTADAFSLCFKSGNAVILKGGSDALYSNKAIVSVIREGLEKSGVTEDAISFIDATDRAVTMEFMKMKEYVDVLIPRGGAGLIRSEIGIAHV